MLNGVAIPLFNESDRFDYGELRILAELMQPDGLIVLVDDGSTDQWIVQANGFLEDNPDLPIKILRLEKNVGKANALRKGFLFLLEEGCEFIGMLDGDFSAPTREFQRVLAKHIHQLSEFDVVCGSRMDIAGRDILKQEQRYIFGRFFAIATQQLFRLDLYDTQCGLKTFRGGPQLEHALREPFDNQWLFDIEILLRLRCHGNFRIWEEPLNIWHHSQGSKMKFWTSLSAFLALFRLKLKYSSTSR